MNYVDIIIVGSGMSGLYSAYKITQQCPSTSFLILEKYKQNWIGGRTSNDTFYGAEIVTGAGIGRKDTNPLLIQLMKKLHVAYTEFHSTMDYANTFTPVDIVKVIDQLKKEYKKHPELHHNTFKEFSTQVLGNKLYHQFIVSAGYTDYEDADVHETLYNYGMDDNKGGWTGLRIPWKKMVHTLYQKIGKEHFRFSSDVVEINKLQRNPCLFELKTKNNKVYHCNRVIVATTISGIKKLVPGAAEENSLYQQIHGQPFLRLYAKFDAHSADIMRHYVSHYTIVPGPLQKIIPMNADKGIYMIAYSDNDNALLLKDHLKNNPINRALFCKLIEESLGMAKGTLKIIALKDYYWPIGTHYYEPLPPNGFQNRSSFVHRAQRPQKGMLVVGEVVSRYQGWTEGALESVEAVLTKTWIQEECS